MKNITDLGELVNWNSSAGICRLWEQKNPLLKKGINTPISQSFELESKLQREYELMCEKHNRIGRNILIVVILAIAITAIAASAWYVAAVALISIVGSMFWIWHMNKTQASILRDITAHTSRIIRFNEYIVGLSDASRICTEDLFTYPTGDLQEKIDKVLKHLAGIVVDSNEFGDDSSKSFFREKFNDLYDLSIDGGLIPLSSYGDYFSQQVPVKVN